MTKPSTTQETRELEPQLLRCPFCGNKGRMREHVRDKRVKNPITNYYVECQAWLFTNGCSAVPKSKHYDSPEQAAAAWNTRAPSATEQVIRPAPSATWTDKVPANPTAGDAYYFVRRKDKLDVVIMGFSMGKGWLNGVSHEPSEMRSHLFLGPITPDLFEQVIRLGEALEATARNLHVVGGYHHPATVSFESCPRASCVAARAALQPKAETEVEQK